MIPRLLIVPAALLALALAATGCGGDEGPEPAPAPTRIADLSATTALARVAFCDLIPDAAVSAAAGSGAEEDSWGNGDPVPDVGADVAHEVGCAWVGPGKRAARAWVFARPVTAAFANETIPTLRRTGCSVQRTGTFGKPGAVQTCALGRGVNRVRLAGLFGDSWLTCEVTGPGPVATLRTRVDPWCAAAAGALETSG